MKYLEDVTGCDRLYAGDAAAGRLADTTDHDRWEAQSRAEAGHFWFNGFRAFVRPALVDATGGVRDLRILDCGCGTGYNLPMLAPFGQVFAFELAPEGVSRAAASNGTRAIIRASIMHIPFQSHSFDLVTLFDVLQCIPDDIGGLREATRVLRPGGTALITVAAFEALRGDHSEVWRESHRYTRNGILRRVKAAGLQPLRASFLFATTLPIMLAVRTWQRLSRPFRRWRPDFDIRTPPRLVNGALTSLLALEAATSRRMPMPIGSSLLVIARKPLDP